MSDTSHVQIRPAGVQDAPALAALWSEIGTHLVDLNPQAFKMPHPAGLTDWFAEMLAKDRDDENIATFIAEAAGEVVGTVSVRIIPAMEDSERQLLREAGVTRALIDVLAVARRFRRQAIGKRLMQRAEEWGRGKGATVFVLDTYAASPLSVPFYERLGYARRSIRFIKPAEYGAPMED